VCRACYLEAEKELAEYNRALDLQKLNQEREIRTEILSMKCPRCGGELEKGYLQAPHGLFWDVKQHDNTVLHSEELIASLYVGIANKEAFRCSKCQLVVLPYAPLRLFVNQ